MAWPRRIQNVTVQRRSDMQPRLQETSWLRQHTVAGIDSMTGIDDGAATLSETAGLSGRKRRVLAPVAQGTDKAVAPALHFSIDTVKNHIRAVFRETGVDKRAEAVVSGRPCGIVNHVRQLRKVGFD